jgi:hypothetical protein
MTRIAMQRVGSKPAEESHYESDEPVRGLPARLPAGERMLWQGEPNWKVLALRTFHVRKIAIYFGVLLAWDVFSTLHDGQTLADQGEALLQLAGLGSAALGIICLFCYAVSRTTVYTVTSKRVVIRAGIALPKTINIPYARIASAGVKVSPDGSGNVLLTPLAEDKIAYLLLWPHVQAWNLSHARPMLRGVADAGSVAQILGNALAAEGDGQAMSAAKPQSPPTRANQHATAAA